MGPPMVLLALAMAWTYPLATQWRRSAPATLSHGHAPPGGSTLVSQVFGSGRKVLSHRLMVEADRFFHHGVAHQAPGPRTNHPFAAWANAISPTRHRELTSDTVVEMMPWLQMAIGVDPTNSEAYAAAAYWLMRNGQMDQSIRVLRRAKMTNPGDYRFYLLQGELYFLNGDLELALAEIEEAARIWPNSTALKVTNHAEQRRHMARLHGSTLLALGRGDEVESMEAETRFRLAQLAQSEHGSTAAPSGEHAHLLNRHVKERHVHHATCDHVGTRHRTARR
jgi:hypothetical protein